MKARAALAPVVEIRLLMHQLDKRFLRHPEDDGKRELTQCDNATFDQTLCFQLSEALGKSLRANTRQCFE